MIRINLASKGYLKDSKEPLNDKIWFLEIIRHEYIHAIDFLAPHISVLGAQITHLSDKHYIISHFDFKGKEDFTLNKMNPLEVNAYGDFDKFGSRD